MSQRLFWPFKGFDSLSTTLFYLMTILSLFFFIFTLFLLKTLAKVFFSNTPLFQSFPLTKLWRSHPDREEACHPTKHWLPRASNVHQVQGSNGARRLRLAKFMRPSTRRLLHRTSDEFVMTRKPMRPELPLQLELEITLHALYGFADTNPFLSNANSLVIKSGIIYPLKALAFKII